MKNYDADGKFFFEFVKNNLSADPVRLLLSGSDELSPDKFREAVVQIECRQKTSRKLSSFITNDRFIFPSLLSAEQATHQCVAAYHSLITGSDKNILDMTAGLGIDIFSLAKTGNQATAIEMDPERVRALQWNRDVLQLNNMQIYEADSLQWIKENRNRVHFDILFADPARRDKFGGRTYFLRDCRPDIVGNFQLLGSIADMIMIKASPIIDIDKVIAELSEASGKSVVKEIHIVCLKGECKEVLILCDNRQTHDDPDIVIVDLEDDPEANVDFISRFTLSKSERGNCPTDKIANDIKSGWILYDPNAGIHKITGARKLCEVFPGLRKLSSNTDLYVSDELYENFPGRKFRIEKILNKSDVKALAGQRRDVATRNYPLSAEELRKKLKTRSSSEQFIYGCRHGIKNTPLLIDVTKIR